jgi:hypothetical protein
LRQGDEVGRSIVEECPWMHQRVWMCAFQTRRGRKLEQSGSEPVCMLRAQGCRRSVQGGGVNQYTPDSRDVL